MALYHVQVASTPEAWAIQLHNLLNRREAVSQVVERLGRYIESAYDAFGDYDAILIIDMPDHVSAAAFSHAVSAGGAVKAIKTTTLLTIEDGIEAMRKGAGAGYRPRATNASRWRAYPPLCLAFPVTAWQAATGVMRVLSGLGYECPSTRR